MPDFAKLSRLTQLMTFVACGSILTSVSINTDQSSVFAQEMKSTPTPLVISQNRRGYQRDTRRLRAESGPDDRGRWRFYKPEDVSRDAMQAQGCTDVGTGGANWRCPRSTIRVEVDDNRRDNDRRDYGRDTQRLRAESGPDDRGRWRFYKPEDVSRDAMQAQGCTDVGTGGANWRCPRSTIRVEVDDNRRDNDRRDNNRRRDYGRDTRRLRAESGPDNRRRWRFYKPGDVSPDAMQAQGCTNVGTGGANWRCPRPTIRVEVDNRDD